MRHWFYILEIIIISLDFGGSFMDKTYVIWWHSRFVEEIDREFTTFEDIVDKTSKVIKYLDKLKALEITGKIRIKQTGTLNPIYIDVLDNKVESEVENNPLVEILDDPGVI
jgi:hypothetical protein